MSKEGLKFFPPSQSISFGEERLFFSCKSHGEAVSISRMETFQHSISGNGASRLRLPKQNRHNAKAISLPNEAFPVRFLYATRPRPSVFLGSIGRLRRTRFGLCNVRSNHFLDSYFYIASLSTVGQLLACPLVGALATRFGRRGALMALCLPSCAGWAVVGASGGDFAWLCAGRLLQVLINKKICFPTVQFTKKH